MITNVRELIKLHEGKRLKPYVDTTGHVSIGYGRNLTDRGISDQEADAMLDRDIREHALELVGERAWIADLDIVRQAVLVDMAFNLGVAGLLAFKKTLTMIATGDYDGAAVEILRSAWAEQVGTRALRLADMLRTGEWPDG